VVQETHLGGRVDACGEQNANGVPLRACVIEVRHHHSNTPCNTSSIPVLKIPGAKPGSVPMLEVLHIRWIDPFLQQRASRLSVLRGPGSPRPHGLDVQRRDDTEPGTYV
jgi:hypothetical protein